MNCWSNFPNNSWEIFPESYWNFFFQFLELSEQLSEKFFKKLKFSKKKWYLPMNFYSDSQEEFFVKFQGEYFH